MKLSWNLKFQLIEIKLEACMELSFLDIITHAITIHANSDVSVQSLSHVRLFVTPWTTAHQASLSITDSQSLPKLMSIESVMPSNQLIFCRPLLLLPPIFPSIRVFSNESVLCIGQSIGASVSSLILHHQSFQ